MNQLFQGDNLEILHNMPGGSVDLICTDPPFNTGKDWGAFDDRWEGGLDEYLKFMEARVVECRRVLKDTGSLYLHCDPTASHYLKVMLDSVFGIKQFRNEIVWRKYGGHKNNASHKFTVQTDNLLFYGKSDLSVFQPVHRALSDDTIRHEYKHIDENGRRYAIPRGRSYYSGVKKRLYLDTHKGVRVSNLWTEKELQLNTSSSERLDYPTQKPVALYARMIKASSNQGDVVLDPFAGSGTTLDAAESLGRKWIGIDIGDEAIEIIQTRLRDRHGLMLEYELVKSKGDD